MNIDPYFIPHTKINSIWITAINVDVKIIILIEENRRKSL